MQTHFKKTNIAFFAGTAILLFSLDLLAQQPSASPLPDQSATQPAPTAPPAASAQAAVPQAQSAVQAAAQAAGQVAQPATQDSNGTGSSTASALDYLFNHKPQQGTVAKEGMTASEQAKTDALAQDALGNQQIQDPQMRAQFETYLAMNQVPQDQLTSYSNDMNNVIDLLHQKKQHKHGRNSIN